jgi:hypothetical protein
MAGGYKRPTVKYNDVATQIATEPRKTDMSDRRMRPPQQQMGADPDPSAAKERRAAR